MTARAVVIWGALGVALVAPLVAAAFSPLLAWRQPIYIAAGFAGILGLGLMVLQPLLVGGYLPGIGRMEARRLHRVVGVALVVCVLGHVAGLWITSPPDVIDALLFRSPAVFSYLGVIAMIAVLLAAGFAVLRRRLGIRLWRLGHTALVLVAVGGTVVHAVLIEGTMEAVTKYLLCALALGAAAKAVLDLRVWVLMRSRR
ncbi:MAG: ferric reductase-like transmembrane domain-containing protein [Pseudomonadota bacterium]